MQPRVSVRREERGRGRLHTYRKGRGHVTLEAEMGAKQPQLKEYQQSPKAGKDKEWILPSGSQGDPILGHLDFSPELISDFWPKEV